VHQFDIVENLNPTTRGRFPFVIVLQHNNVSAFSFLVAAPLTQATRALTSSRLHPEISVADRRFVMLTEELAAVHLSTLGRVAGSAEENRYAIVAALDLLFTGI
jgi:toxin CcdB